MLDAAAVGSCPALRPARLQLEEGEAFTVLPALSSPRQPPPVCDLLPSVRAQSSDKFWGTPRRLFFNCPTATHLPPAGWRLAPPSHPPLASPPPSSPPHPHPEARTRHREEPGLGAPGAAPFTPERGPAGGRGAAARRAAAGNPRQGSLEPAPRRLSHRCSGNRTERPGRLKDQGRDPGARAPGSARSPPQSRSAQKG